MRAGLRGSFLYSSAVGEERRRSVICTRVRVSCVFQNNFLPWEARVALVSAIFKTTLLFQNFQTSKQQGRRWYVLAARVVARELMPYAMIRPVSKTALSPLSSNVIPNLRALPRICLSLSISFSFSSYDLGSVGNRTGGVERPHGLDCGLERVSVSFLSS